MRKVLLGFLFPFMIVFVVVSSAYLGRQVIIDAEKQHVANSLKILDGSMVVDIVDVSYLQQSGGKFTYYYRIVTCENKNGRRFDIWQKISGEKNLPLKGEKWLMKGVYDGAQCLVFDKRKE